MDIYEAIDLIAIRLCENDENDGDRAIRCYFEKKLKLAEGAIFSKKYIQALLEEDCKNEINE